MNAVVPKTSIALAPCPFCSGVDLHIETDSHPGSTFQVMCDNPHCEAEGPNTAKTADDAANLWNRRPNTEITQDDIKATVRNIFNGMSWEAYVRTGEGDEDFEIGEDELISRIERAITEERCSVRSYR